MGRVGSHFFAVVVSLSIRGSVGIGIFGEVQ